jgi:hypothetical protein
MMVMRPLIIILFLFVFLSQNIFAKRTSETFKVEFLDKETKIISPKKFQKKLSVIVTNKSLSKIIFKTLKETGESLGFYILNPKQFQSVDLNFSYKTEEFYLIPYAPPSQKIILKIGQDAYEIPSIR